MFGIWFSCVDSLKHISDIFQVFSRAFKSFRSRGLPWKIGGYQRVFSVNNKFFISFADYSQAELICKFGRRPYETSPFFLSSSFGTVHLFPGSVPKLCSFHLDIFFMNFHQNSLKLLLLLHFSMDSFETRYTYPGSVPKLCSFQNFKFGFSDFLYEFSSNFH